jgi:hypothetical protein
MDARSLSREMRPRRTTLPIACESAIAKIRSSVSSMG